MSEQNETESKKQTAVTRESVGLLLFAVYMALKKGERVALGRTITEAGMPAQPIMKALFECKILENQGSSGQGAEWKWLPITPPNDLLIEKVVNHYATEWRLLQQKLKESRDKRDGINRRESGPAVPVAKDSPQVSVYIRERFELIESKQKYIVDLLETLCRNLGVIETDGGIRI